MALSNNKDLHKTSAVGFMMVDVIVGIAISAVMLFAFSELLYQTIKLNSLDLASLKAQLYMNEVAEVSRELEHSQWTQLSNGTCTLSSPCHPEVQSGVWVLVPGAETLDGVYTRSLYIEDVYRDQLIFPNTIVLSSGVLDPDTKKVIASVSWNASNIVQTMALETYAYNF
jgi:hypothetical protein